MRGSRMITAPFGMASGTGGCVARRLSTTPPFDRTPASSCSGRGPSESPPSPLVTDVSRWDRGQNSVAPRSAVMASGLYLKLTLVERCGQCSPFSAASAADWTAQGWSACSSCSPEQGMFELPLKYVSRHGPPSAATASCSIKGLETSSFCTYGAQRGRPCWRWPGARTQRRSAARWEEQWSITSRRLSSTACGITLPARSSKGRHLGRHPSSPAAHHPHPPRFTEWGTHRRRQSPRGETRRQSARAWPG